MAAAILRFLTGHMNPKRNGVLISTAALAEIFGVSRRTIERAVKILRDNRFINIVRTGRSNAYFINASIIRCDKINEKTYFDLNARVLFSCTEMAQMATDMKKMEMIMHDDINASLSDLFGA